jgi:proline iminopeptidase
MKLPVGDGHVVYYEVHGLGKKTAIVLHGGPGGGLQRGQLQHFDLTRWRVILFDQRGCGGSTPFLSVSHNTTWDLVSDMEKLRIHLDIDKWLVFGGSWGSTLALAYASKHEDHVSAMVLRGVCLMEAWEQRWLYEEGGASRIFPEAWPAFVAGAKSGRGTLSQRYGRLLSNRKTRKAAAKAWWNWESAISFLEPKPDHSSPKQITSLAVLENHYFRHNAWLKPGFLLAAAAKMQIPTVIVQGRYDLVCPIASAYALRKAMTKAKCLLIVSKKAGHAGSEPPTAYALRKATDMFAQLL